MLTFGCGFGPANRIQSSMKVINYLHLFDLCEKSIYFVLESKVKTS
jgi:hypothetical protein